MSVKEINIKQKIKRTSRRIRKSAKKFYEEELEK